MMVVKNPLLIRPYLLGDGGIGRVGPLDSPMNVEQTSASLAFKATRLLSSHTEQTPTFTLHL